MTCTDLTPGKMQRLGSKGRIRSAVIAAGLALWSASTLAQQTAAPAPQNLPDGIEITIDSLNPPSPPGDKPFTRLEAREIGIYRPLEYSIRDHWPPFWNGRGISSGDIDRDGDDDIVLGSSDRGLHIFENLGDGTFREVTPPIPLISGLPVIIAALADINNDGWQDIFLTTYQAGNYILWNENGNFSEDRMTRVKNRDDGVLSASVAFADVDKDGDLDMALGNWAAGWYRRVPGPEAINRIVFNDDGKMTGENMRELLGMPGESLSILLSDFDLDGNVDLLVGNDFVQPDLFYLGDGKGGFAQIRPGDDIIPVSTTTTMSMKTGDLDNDLVPEIYISQIAGRAEGIRDTLKLRPADFYCSDIDHDEDRARCQANIDVRGWYKVGGRQAPVSEATRCREGTKEFESRCKAMLIKDVAIQRKDPSICTLIPSDQPRAILLCEIHFRPSIRPTKEQYAENIQQIRGRNVLLVADGKRFRDRTEAWGLGIGGWSWDVKIADFDLNEFQDLYVTNGSWVLGRVNPSNMYFRNFGNGKFKDETEEFGLTEYLILSSVTTVDYDNDGDQDIIGQAVNGPVIAFRNNAQAGNRIVFRFEDYAANRFGIGNKIAVHYGPEAKRHQMREIQAGGGFLSFDSPKAFFALGAADSVARIEVEWSTGEKTTIQGPFQTGSIYTVIRNNATGQ